MRRFLFDESFDPISRVWRNDAVYPSLDFSEKRRGREYAKSGVSGEKNKRYTVKKRKKGGVA